MVNHWNIHSINNTRNVDIPSGKPNIMFFTPEVYGTYSYGTPVDIESVDVCMEMYAHEDEL